MKNPLSHLIVRLVVVALFLSGLLGGALSSYAVEHKASELMEQGVYSEETKGDLDAAIQLYQQVVTEAAAGQALGAQAQFRLAMCYDKKGDHVAARAAFAKLVHDYPTQKDLVAIASEKLSDVANLLPVPWSDGEEMWFDVNLQSGMNVGIAHFAVAADKVNGRKIWRLNSHLFAGVQQWSRMESDANSFRPIRSHMKHTLVGDVVTDYTTTGADVKMHGVDTVKHVELTGAVFDNEQAVQLMRRLRLSVGSSSDLVLFVGLSGGQVLNLEIKVEASETLVVPAGTFECLRLGTNIGQTFWYSTDVHHYLVKYEGGGVVAELASVRQRSLAVPHRLVDVVRGFSITVPTGWMAHRRDEGDEVKVTSITLLDPEAIGITRLKVERRDRTADATPAAVRAFAEHQLERAKKFAKAFEARPDSWKDMTVAGQPAVSVLVDILDGKKKQVIYGVYAFVDGNSVDFSTVTAPEDFEAIRPQFEAIVGSYGDKDAK